jgi:hypothetical protein
MKKILVALFLLFSLNANAWLLIEPYIGGDIGTKSEITPWIPPTEIEYNGFIYGGRLGFVWKILMLGVDMSGMSGNVNISDSGGEVEESATKSSFGAFAGVNIDLTAIGLRAWVSYFFSNKLSAEEYFNTELKGNGWGIGAGITLIKFLGINFEYRGNSFDELTSNGGNATIDYKPSEFVISLSVPLLNLF